MIGLMKVLIFGFFWVVVWMGVVGFLDVLCFILGLVEFVVGVFLVMFGLEFDVGLVIFVFCVGVVFGFCVGVLLLGLMVVGVVLEVFGVVVV